MAEIQDVINNAKRYNKKSNSKKIQKAYDYAKAAHGDQLIM